MLPRVIGLCGHMGSGKSTVAAMLSRMYGYKRIKFSAPLKDMMRALGLTEDEIEGSLKELPCAALCGQTPRYAMQTIGTEWGRRLIGPDVWVSAWETKAATGMVVAEDCRFLNEARAVIELGGLLIRVERDGCFGDGHESEKIQLPHSIILRNDGDPHELMESVAWTFEQLERRSA